MLKAPQQKRSERTLQRILDVCEDLIGAGRFEQVSMNEIATQSGVSVGTLYKRFDSKSAIIEYLVEQLQTQQYDRMVQELAECKETSFSARFRFLSMLIYRSCDEYNGLLRTVMAAHLSGTSPLSGTTNTRSVGLIDALATWLSESPGSPDFKACREAVAIVSFAYQYRAIYPTPDALLGADVYQSAVYEMALNYLGG